MRGTTRRFVLGATLAWLATLCICSVARAHGPRPLEGLVAVNGVQLQYLDWQGTGPALIFIPGLGDDPHGFEDLAGAFTDRFHVIAYARRGSAGSQMQGPYDSATLTEDLRGLMDALGIAKADLAGSSAAGNEITAMAARHPERVRRIVYLDAGYDGADPEFRKVLEARPTLERPASALASLDAFRSYEKAMRYPELDDMARVEAYLRARVIIQTDGSLRERMPADIRKELYAALISNPQRDYTKVYCPALAIFAERYYPAVADAGLRRRLSVYDEKYWRPFQLASIERMRRDLANLQIARVPGAHGGFIFTSRARVVELMSRFLSEDHVQTTLR